ncbi:hypothetical protein J1N35_038835 [Gossypium stocksii]|uniref:DUF4283 domain-containing protein n=1 Tax=Gossypium stocksii TaxID=47602 RepID=A0A9D3UMU2_9ROSI|nr:hypothetical protein J1N35_038835 [Gossypium stocksii]
MEDFSLNYGNNFSHLDSNKGIDSQQDVDRSTKKVRFKDGSGEEDTDMILEVESSPKIFWKDKLLGLNSGALDKTELGSLNADVDEKIEFLEGDIHRSIINIQPWTKEFNPLQPYPSMMLAWIRLPGLPGYLYKKKIIEEIGGTIGKSIFIPAKDQVTGVLTKTEKRDKPMAYGPWMVVERRNKWQSRRSTSIKVDIMDGKSGSRFGALANMEGMVDLDVEQNKGNKGNSTKFQEKMKAANFERLQGKKGRGSANNNIKKMGVDKSGNVPLILADTQADKLMDPVVKVGGHEAGTEDLLAGAKVAESAKATLNLGSFDGKQVAEPANEVLKQDTNGVDPNSYGTSSHFAETGSFSNSITDPDFNFLPNKILINKLNSNFNSNPVNFLCVNPIFVEQGGKEDMDVASNLKSFSLGPELVVLNIADFSESLCPNKHSAVSFKEKGQDIDINLQRASSLISSGNKARNNVKIMGGKDGSIRDSRKTNKTPHGKGNALKIKNPPKFPLSDSMSRLAQTISIRHTANPGIVAPCDGGKS